MSDHDMDKHEARRYLDAFADGELGVEQNLRVLEQMAMDPANTRRVLHQHQLRRATRQAMDRPQCQAPAELRARIETMAANEPAQTPTPRTMGGTLSVTEAKPSIDDQPDHSDQRQDHPSPSVLARIGQWAPTAAAACLLIAALGVFYTARSQGGGNSKPGANPTADQATSVSNVLYTNFLERHQTCSKDVTTLFDTVTFPRKIKPLPGKIEDYFSQTAGPVPGHLIHSLDLSVLGYHFVEAGACVVPGVGSVHIVYRRVNSPTHKPRTTAEAQYGSPSHANASALIKPTANDNDSARRRASASGSTPPVKAQAISLWVKPTQGKYELKPGKVYQAAGDDSDTKPPLLIWERAGRLYFLIGDVPGDVNKAADLLCHE